MNSNRRNVIRSLAGGGLILPGLLSEMMAEEDKPLAPKKPHFAPKAKRVIFLFMTGVLVMSIPSIPNLFSIKTTISLRPRGDVITRVQVGISKNMANVVRNLVIFFRTSGVWLMIFA